MVRRNSCSGLFFPPEKPENNNLKEIRVFLLNQYDLSYLLTKTSLCDAYFGTGLVFYWSDPKINFVFVLHKRLFVFVHAIRLCAVPELNFVRWRKRGS